MHRLRNETRALLSLAGPIVVGQLAQVGMGFTDTVMAGRLGAADLAAVAMGSTLWLVVYLAGLGLLSALAPIVAQLHGAGRPDAIRRMFGQSLWIAAALAALAIPLTRHLDAVMVWIQVDAEIIPLTRAYLRAFSWGLPGGFLYLCLRFVNEGIGNTRPMMFIHLGGLAANVLGNYMLMFGKFGAPALGAVGAGWSTAIVFTLHAAAMLIYVLRFRRPRALSLSAGLGRPRGPELRHLFHIGLPIAATLVLEIGMFAAVTLLMGSLGTAAVASHQIAISFASLTFTVAFAIGIALTVRVGHAAGRGDLPAARFAGLVGMGLAGASMAVSAAVMLTIPEWIVSAYTRDAAVAGLAARLLMLAAVFQLSDGLQASALGALRGLKDTARPMWLTFIAYWLVGLPLAWLLGISRALGPTGLWLGLIAGLTAAAVLLCARFLRLSASSMHA